MSKALPIAPLMFESASLSEHGAKTKWNIFVTAVGLFSEHGFNAVSMRDIAKEVGVRAGAIYNHFQSKDHLIQEMYTFYRRNSASLINHCEHLLSLADTANPLEVLSKMSLHYDSQYELLMSQIIKIAMSNMQKDKNAYNLVHTVFYDEPERVFRPVVDKLIKLGKVKPIDVDAYLEIFRCMCLSSSFRMNTTDEIEKKEWGDMTSLLYSLIL